MENKVPNIPCDERCCFCCWDFYAMSRALFLSPCACECANVHLCDDLLMSHSLSHRSHHSRKKCCCFDDGGGSGCWNVNDTETHTRTHTDEKWAHWMFAKLSHVVNSPKVTNVWFQHKHVSGKKSEKRSIYACFFLFMSVWCIFYCLRCWMETKRFGEFSRLFHFAQTKICHVKRREAEERRAHLVQLLSKVIWNIFKCSFSFSVIHTNTLTHTVQHTKRICY